MKTTTKKYFSHQITKWKIKKKKKNILNTGSLPLQNIRN